MQSLIAFPQAIDQSIRVAVIGCEDKPAFLDEW